MKLIGFFNVFSTVAAYRTFGQRCDSAEECHRIDDRNKRIGTIKVWVDDAGKLQCEVQS